MWFISCSHAAHSSLNKLHVCYICRKKQNLTQHKKGQKTNTHAQHAHTVVFLRSLHGGLWEAVSVLTLSSAACRHGEVTSMTFSLWTPSFHQCPGIFGCDAYTLKKPELLGNNYDTNTQKEKAVASSEVLMKLHANKLKLTSPRFNSLPAVTYWSS